MSTKFSSKMMPRMSYLRLFHELTFAIYVPLIVVLVKANAEDSRFFDRMAYPIALCYPLLRYVHLVEDYTRRSRPTEGDRHLTLVIALWAAILFAVLHILERIPAIRSSLAYCTGVVVVVGLPWFGSFNAGGLSSFSPAEIKWMWAELIAMVVSLILYTYRGWPPSLALTLLVTGHFCLWGWFETYWQTYVPFFIITGVIWIYYVKPFAGPLPPKK
jgi:hypothetical protein